MKPNHCSFAIIHDTPRESGCEAFIPDNLTTVMSPTISIRTAGWSNCSGQFLKFFLKWVNCTPPSYVVTTPVQFRFWKMPVRCSRWARVRLGGPAAWGDVWWRFPVQGSSGAQRCTLHDRNSKWSIKIVLVLFRYCWMHFFVDKRC